jgi:hypothetical protein
VGEENRSSASLSNLCKGQANFSSAFDTGKNGFPRYGTKDNAFPCFLAASSYLHGIADKQQLYRVIDTDDTISMGRYISTPHISVPA